MNLEQLNAIDEMRHFLDGTQAVARNVATNKQERYLWVQKGLVKHRYILLGKLDKGLITRYLMKVTGYSRAQMDEHHGQPSGALLQKLCERAQVHFNITGC